MKIKIERGIISLNDNEEIIVYSPGRIHPINPVSLDTSIYRNGEKVIGVIIDKKFTPLQQLEQIENTVAFGYVLDFDPDTRYISIQLIKDFSLKDFNRGTRENTSINSFLRLLKYSLCPVSVVIK